MNFPCPRCHNNLEIDPDNTDSYTDCPQCSFPISVPPSEQEIPRLYNFGSLDPAELLMRGMNTVQRSKSGQWTPPEPEELAALLPQYQIESLIGRGGMGAVYKGRQAALDRPVAIKLLPAEIANQHFIARFQREARTLAKLQHPGIVTVYDFGQTSEGHLYFIMEFVDGTDLSHLIHGPGLSPVQTLELISQICEALQYAHEHGVIHRDIKPANILINKEGRAKLADFGLARPPENEQEQHLTKTNVSMGTPDYMAPEQSRGQTDHRADIYSLGVMLYEMLCKRTPKGAWHPPSHRMKTDARIDQVVLKAMQEELDHRYQHASEVKTDVDIIRASHAPPVISPVKLVPKKALAAPATLFAQAVPPPRKFRKLWIGFTAAVMVLLAGGGWWMRQKQLASNVPAISTGGETPAPVEAMPIFSVTEPVAPVDAMPIFPAADPSRLAAEWALSLGGTVKINNKQDNILKLADLPAASFTLHTINLSSVPTGNKALMADDALAPLAGVKELNTLDLTGTSVTDKGMDILENLPALADLRFSNCIHITDESFRHLAQKAKLNRIILDRTAVTGEGFVHLESCPALRQLTASECPLSLAGWQALGRLKQLTSLHVNSSRTFGKEAFASLKSLQQLQTLAAGNYFSTDVDLEGIVDFPNLTSLRLEGKFSDKTVQRVATLKNLDSFYTGFKKNEITSSGLATLSEMPKLKCLFIQNVTITTEGFQLLAKSKSLEEIVVSTGTQMVSDEAIAAFRQARPEVKVRRATIAGVTPADPVNNKP